MSLEQLRASRPGQLAGLAMLRMLGVLTVLVLLALPRGEAAAAPTPVARDLAARDLGTSIHTDEDGACEEIEPQELLECGAQYDDMLDQPIVLSLLRALGVRLSADTCNELLADLWAEQICEVGSLDCGKMNAAGPPGPPLEMVSGSSSGHSSWASSSLSAMSGKGLSAFADQTVAFGSRDLQPPVPPPR
jgi:hypothetical protein